MIKSNHHTASLALLLVAMLWGSSTVLNKVALTAVDPFSLIAMRFTLAFIVTFIIYFRKLPLVTARTLKRVLVLGTLLFLLYGAAIYGVRSTSASNAGVLTCLAGIFIPIIEFFFFRKKLSLHSTLCVLTAFAGIFVLMGGITASFHYGDFLCLLCSLVSAFHIILTGRWVTEENAVMLSVLQLGVVALYSSVFAFTFETVILPLKPEVLFTIFVLGIFCSAAAYVIQTVAQQSVSPLRTGIILSTEPVFGTLAAFLFWNEVLSPKEYLGIAAMIIAVVMMELRK